MSERDHAAAGQVWAWLRGKLFVALLLERLIEDASVFPPGAARWNHRRSRWRETRFLARELVAAINPRLGLRWALAHWETIARGLSDTPRKRKRQHLS